MSARMFLLASLALGISASAAITPGEILIGELNCVACHDAPDAVKKRLASRQPPKIGEHGLRITPQWLRAWLIDPQSQKPGALMPHMLHALPDAEKASAADALTHYLISLQKTDTRVAASASRSAAAAGRALYHTIGCVACHAPEALPESAANRPGAEAELEALRQASVPMGQLATKLTVNELATFLKDPLWTRPSGRMPSLKLTDGEARAIAMFLLHEQALPSPGGDDAAKLRGLNYEYYDVDLPELPQFDRLKPKSIGIAETFTLAVAGRKNDFALRFRGVITVPRDGEYKFFVESDDGARLYINEKLLIDNGGIHPAQERSEKINLKAGDHAIVVTYFDGGGTTAFKVSWRGPGIDRQEIPASVLSHEGQPMQPLGSAPFTLDPEKVAVGKGMFARFNCAACHDPGAASGKAKPLAQLTGAKPAGCLSTNPPAGTPKFTLTEKERADILAQLGAQASLSEKLDADQRVERTLSALNCYACHEREGKGSSQGLRREYFVSNGEIDLGDEGRLPPHLNKIGAKLKPEWLQDVLCEGGVVRPYMATRMPQYGDANVEHLVKAFEEADAAALPDAIPEPEVTHEKAKWGRKLLGTGGLTCIACHTFAGHPSLGVPAVDLATVRQRLRWEWLYRYLLDPQLLRPGTRMPAFWPGGVAVNKDILKGNTDEQIGALWSYLVRKNFTDLPDGLMQGKQELVAEKEAVIYRNFIDGGGPRAIGVGYPEKANLAFDANEMRLAMIWQGPFIDAAKHRTGRGVGFEKPLGRNIVKGAPGVPFAILDDEAALWPKRGATDLEYKFRGYTLDAQRRPTFRYSFRGVSVEDFPEASPGEIDATFKRTITLRADAPVQKLYFRAAVSEKIEEKGGEGYVVGGHVRLKFGDAKAVVRKSEGRDELLVPVKFNGNEAKIVEEISW